MHHIKLQAFEDTQNQNLRAVWAAMQAALARFESQNDAKLALPLGGYSIVCAPRHKWGLPRLSTDELPASAAMSPRAMIRMTTFRHIRLVSENVMSRSANSDRDRTPQHDKPSLAPRKRLRLSMRIRMCG